jgi:FkbM family methyltransferase
VKPLSPQLTNSLLELCGLAIAPAKRLIRPLIRPFRTVRVLTVAPADLIKRKLRGRSSIFFVQVGSNDGLNGDPLHNLIKGNPRWKGVFIEPVRYTFDRLRSNYNGDDRFVFENIAISESVGEVDFFYVSEDAKAKLGQLPYWYDQLGSFDREHIVKHLEGRLEPFIVKERVKCETLNHVLSRNRVSKIDLLHIDVEGFDYNILAQVDFLRYRPDVILFEHRHLTSNNKRNAVRLLKSHGYTLGEFGGDTLAWLGWRRYARLIGRQPSRAHKMEVTGKRKQPRVDQ